jgi:RHS repeat-associated protein
LREGKEYIDDFWWNKYDYGWRAFDSWNGRSLQRDPMAAKFAHVGAYVAFLNNPLRFIDPDGRQAWPSTAKQAMGYDNYLRAYNQNPTKPLTEMMRGTLNTLLFVSAIPQAIIGGFASQFTEDKHPPNWTTPMQFDQNWSLEQKDGWTKETLSWEDGKEVIKGTLGAILFFIPFSKASNIIQEIVENSIISSSIAVTIEVATSSQASTTNTAPSLVIPLPSSTTNNDNTPQINPFKDRSLDPLYENIFDPLREF